MTKRIDFLFDVREEIVEVLEFSVGVEVGEGGF